MVKMIPFPKEEYARYLEALNHYQQKDYDKAIQAFKEISHLPHFRPLITKPFVHSNMELKKYRDVYDFIEDTFLEPNSDEDYLIERYVYTMILEKNYDQANQLISILLDAGDISEHLTRSLKKLRHMVQEFKRKEAIENKLEEIEFSYHSNLIDLVMNLDQLDIQEYQQAIYEILQDKHADPFIKYQLLEYLRVESSIKSVPYINSFDEHFTIDFNQFTPIYETDTYIEPPKMAYSLLQKTDYSIVVDLKFIQNIWLNEYICAYPKVFQDHELIAFHLRDKVLYLMGEKEQFGQFLIF